MPLRRPLVTLFWVQAEAAAALDGRERDDTREQVRYCLLPENFHL
jgi:hypothetical protein